MASRLLQVIRFTAVGAGATVTQAHNINQNGIALTPDYVAPSAAGFGVVVNSATVAVTNNNLTSADVDVWLERKHSITRELGSSLITDLAPQPFIASGGNGASVISTDLTLAGAGTLASPLTRRLSRVARFCSDFDSSTKDAFTSINGAGGSVDQSGSDGGASTYGVMVLQVDVNPGDAVAARLTNSQPGFFGHANTHFFYEARASYRGASADMSAMGLSIGLDQQPTSAPPSSGYYFAAGDEYGLAGNNWYTCLAGLGTAIDTGVAVKGGNGVNGFQVMRIEGDSDVAGNVTARFYIDGVLVGTRNPGIYAQLCCVQAGRMERGAIVGTKQLWVDYVDCVVDIDRTLGT